MTLQRSSHAERTRALVRREGQASLASHSNKMEGYPFVSLVEYADLEDGSPILLLSDLAEHAKNLQSDPRASLLVAGPGGLLTERATLVGRIDQVEKSGSYLERYLARHPQAEKYAAFKDFKLYRLEVERVRFVGGFGRMGWFGAEDYQQALPDPIFQARHGIIEHMNEDHLDAMQAIYQMRTGRFEEKLTMVDIDRFGYELEVTGGESLGVAFPKEATSAMEVRKFLVQQTQEARRQLT